eukprot:UN21829
MNFGKRRLYKYKFFLMKNRYPMYYLRTTIVTGENGKTMMTHTKLKRASLSNNNIVVESNPIVNNPRVRARLISDLDDDNGMVKRHSKPEIYNNHKKYKNPHHIIKEQTDTYTKLP